MSALVITAIAVAALGLAFVGGLMLGERLERRRWRAQTRDRLASIRSSASLNDQQMLALRYSLLGRNWES